MSETVDNPLSPEQAELVNGYVIVNSANQVMDGHGIWSPYEFGDPDTRPFVHTPRHLAEIVGSNELVWNQFSVRGATPPKLAYPAVFDPQSQMAVLKKDMLPLDYHDLQAVVRPELLKLYKEQLSSAGSK